MRQKESTKACTQRESILKKNGRSHQSRHKSTWLAPLIHHSAVRSHSLRALSFFPCAVCMLEMRVCVCARTEQAKNISTIAICPITMLYTKPILNCAPQNSNSRSCSRCVCVCASDCFFFFFCLSPLY